MPYTKLDAGIIFSTVWREPHATVRVWIALLAMKDLRGEVQSSLPGLADAARVSLPECEAALATFRAPDKYSRTKENEGRRVEDIPGGWFIINHEKYRDLDNGNDRKRKAAARAKRYRDRHAVTHDESLLSRCVTPRDVASPQLSHADADTDSDTNNSKDLTTLGFAAIWKLYPKRAGGNSRADAEKAWKARIKHGVSRKALADGVARYAAFCEATEKTGTEYVKQARTFFGPARHWEESWEIPAKKSAKAPGTIDFEKVRKQLKESGDV